jgi:predicted ATPase
VLTLVGPCGVGKTRLALKLASVVEAEGRRVWVLELAPLADGRLLAQRLADALGIREQSL